MKILQFDNEEDLKILTKKCSKVKDFGSPEKNMKNMFQTCKFYNGLGLSANQIGITERFFIINLPEIKQICVNPCISKQEGFYWTSEGCLSTNYGKGEMVSVKRYKTIHCSFRNEKGEKIDAVLKNLPAQVFQHEMDHMEGKII